MRHGFSLVELSIVLVILGLLTGGILTGQNLIRAAELRSVTTEFQRYQAAIMTFRSKYFALPGDMRNATDFWGASSGCSGASPSGTCNGNGDGLLSSGWPLVDGTSYEDFEAFNQLALAGLIEGDYTGIATGDHTPGDEIARSRTGNMTWWVRSEPAVYSIPEFTYNSLTFSALRSGYTPTIAGGGGLTSEETWNIDTKLDDGQAGTGLVLGVRDSSASVRDVANACVTNRWDQPTSEYVLTDTNAHCRISFIFK